MDEIFSGELLINIFYNREEKQDAGMVEKCGGLSGLSEKL